MLAYAIPGITALATILGVAVEARINVVKHKAERQRRQQHYGKFWQ